MNTTLNPAPTDREREMLAEWVSVWLPIMVAQEKFDPYKDAMQRAENTLFAYRERYGVTGEVEESLAEHHPHPQLTMEQVAHIAQGGELRLEWVMVGKSPSPADITALQSENVRLREALEAIDNKLLGISPAQITVKRIVKEALKGGTK